MSNSRKLAFGSAARVGHVILVTLTGFFMMPFLVGELGERWYGIWVAVGSLVGSYYLIDFGLASAVTRFVTLGVSKSDPARVNQVINTSLRVYLALSMVLLAVTGVLVWLAPVLMDQPDEIRTIRHVLVVVGFTLALGFPFKAFAGIGQAHNRYDLLTLINIVGLVVQLSGTVAAVLAGFGVLGIAYVVLAANVTMDLLLLGLVRFLFPPLAFSRAHYRPDMVKELFTYSSWTFVTQVADQIRLRIDALVVASLINATAVTHYFVGARLAELASTLLYQATNIATPILTRYHAQGRRKEMEDAVFFLTRVNIVAGVFVSGSLCILGTAFVARWMGAGFLDTMPVLFTLTVAMTAGFIVNPLDNLLYAIAKHRVLAMINVGDAVANLGLSLLLGSLWGLWGVAAGTAIPMLVTRFGLVAPYGCRQLGVPYSRYVLEVGRALTFTGAAMAVLAVSVHSLTRGAGYLELILIGAGMAASYALWSWFVALRKPDRDRILAMLFKRSLAGEAAGTTPR